MIELLDLGEGAKLSAWPAGLHLSRPVGGDEDWSLATLGQQPARFAIEALIEQEVLSPVADGWSGPWPAVVASINAGDAGFLIDGLDPCPFLLVIGRESDLGRPDFLFKPRWQFGRDTLDLDRCGPFVRQRGGSRVNYLEGELFRLVEAVEAFNRLPASERIGGGSFRALAEAKALASNVSALMDETLATTEVVVPGELGLEVREDPDGSITFLPTCEGVDPVAFQAAFQKSTEGRDVFSWKDSAKRTVRLVLSPRQQQALQRMREVRGIKGERAEELKKNPAKVFEGLLDVMDLLFWERVIGIGSLPTTSVPKAADIDSGFLDSTEGHEANADNESISSSPESPRTEPAVRHKDGSFLIVRTNQDDVFAADSANALEGGEATIGDYLTPVSLTGKLKAHQREAVRWMWQARRDRKRGVLLADDMGLGKTLEILTHLAWSIEHGCLDEVVDSESQQKRWRPILIVAPLMLIENETWQKDMRKFFSHDGDLFSPILVLHGKGLDSVRATSGRDTQVAAATLDPDKLRAHRVVITNYETVVNYQISLAQLHERQPLWSVIVTDEAQKYKEPRTRLSFALKAIDAGFSIASTGTPVENRLLDLWNIMDVVQPGLLGSATDFGKQYERHADDAERTSAMVDLRDRLRFGQPDAALLRRSKSEILADDLPTKTVVKVPCDLGEEEVRLHRSLIAGLSRSGEPGRHLRALQALVQLYQHPAGPGVRTASVPALLNSSAKLRATVDLLRSIQVKGEKVLIFSRLRDFQLMLARVIETEFGIKVPVINGTTATGRGTTESAASSKSAGRSRQQLLSEFQGNPGFGVCVLSPFVAGIGLTITAANHVIHYGRWWNPAVEAQATDRVYRIGQERPVFVYLPIARDPTGVLARTFDEMLDDLLERRLALANDFLVPQDLEDEFTEELFEELIEQDEAGTGPEKGLQLGDLTRLSHQDFEALTACLYQAKGYQVLLTPQSGDMGADVVAVRGDEVALVQAKWTGVSGALAEEGVGDLIAAQDYYRFRAGGNHFSLILLTNGRTSAPATNLAKQHSIEIVSMNGLAEMLQQFPITLADIDSMEGRRLRGRDAVVSALRALLAEQDRANHPGE